MIEIRYAPAAVRDLEKVGDYISEELKNPSAAIDTINRIQHAINRLSQTPHIGAPLFRHYENTDGYRFIVSGNYLVFYREQMMEIFIDRILYKKRDYLSILLGEVPEEME